MQHNQNIPQTHTHFNTNLGTTDKKSIKHSNSEQLQDSQIRELYKAVNRNKVEYISINSATGTLSTNAYTISSIVIGSFDTHINDDVRHISSSERTKWDNKVSASYDDGVLTLSNN